MNLYKLSIFYNLVKLGCYVWIPYLIKIKIKIEWTRSKDWKSCNIAQVNLNRFKMDPDHKEKVKNMIENQFNNRMFSIVAKIIIGSKSKTFARAEAKGKSRQNFHKMCSVWIGSW